MRIAVANWSRRRAGGVESYLADVMPALERLGHEIGMVSECDDPAGRESIVSGKASLDVCARSMGTAEALAEVVDWRPDVIYLHQMHDPELERGLTGIAPVVAFGHAYYGTCISGSKTHRLPSVHACTRQLGPGCLVRYFPNRCGGLNPLTMLNLYRDQTARLEQMRRYFTVVTFSDHMAHEFRRHGIRSSKLWNEAGISNPNGSLTSRVPAASDEPWRLMFLGRIELLKGVDVLLEAISIVAAESPRRVALRLVGDGSERSLIERHASQITARHSNISIEIRGWLTGPALEREWELAHALIMPSIWPEPFGLVGIEAGSRGLPVVAFASGAIPEWLEDGVNGVLADLDGQSARNLANAMNRLMSDPELYTRMSASAGPMAERFSMDRHVEPLDAILEQAMRSARREAG